MGTPYRECPNCGAHLDAGELCDCRRSEREPRRPEQEPRKPMRLMAICREIDKDTGRIAVYPLKMEIDDRILGALKVRATMNPELRYFILVSARWEKYGTVIAGILKRRSVTRQMWTTSAELWSCEAGCAMRIGLHDAEQEYMSTRPFRTMALMKISAYHKAAGFRRMVVPYVPL